MPASTPISASVPKKAPTQPKPAETPIVNAVQSVASNEKKTGKILYAKEGWTDDAAKGGFFEQDPTPPSPIPTQTPSPNATANPSNTLGNRRTPTSTYNPLTIGTAYPTTITRTPGPTLTPTMVGQRNAGETRLPPPTIEAVNVYIAAAELFYSLPKISDVAGEFGKVLTDASATLATASLAFLVSAGPAGIPAAAVAAGIAGALDTVGNALILQDIFVDMIEESRGSDTVDMDQVTDMIKEGIVEVACSSTESSWEGYSSQVKLALALFCDTF